MQSKGTKIMFDANMRYLRKGRKFFAEIHSCDKDSKLYNLGLRTGEVALCEMLDEDTANPRVKFTVEKGSFVLEAYKSDDAWIVYSGKTNGRGFIHDHYKNKALELLESLGYGGFIEESEINEVAE